MATSISSRNHGFERQDRDVYRAIWKWKIDPRFGWIESWTTRQIRAGDHQGEYHYISVDHFELMRVQNAFLWHRKAHGNYYGTTTESIEQAILREHPTLMHLLPECLPILLKTIPRSVLPFFVHVGNTNELRRRIQRRSKYAGNREIDERIYSCKKWTREAKESNIPYIFIDNGGTLQETMAHVIEGLKQ